LSYNTLEKRYQRLKKKTTDIPKIQVVKKQVQKKNKYQKAVEMIIYHMLVSDEAITQVESEHILFPNELSRIMVSEIIYYYEKFGKLTIADFYTYLQDKPELIHLLDEILSSVDDYAEEITKDVLTDYFKVVKEMVRKQEIKRLKTKLNEEVDELEQAKIADEIRRLRIGENDYGWRN